METLMGVLGAALALLAVFLLYVGGAAVVLRLLERLLPTRSEAKQGSGVSASMS